VVDEVIHHGQVLRLSYNSKAYQRESYEFRIVRFQFVQGDVLQLFSTFWLCVRFSGNEISRDAEKE
jgi:hypothetical protein